MKFTVLGASGFIGGHLVRHLRARGHEVEAIRRDDLPKLSDRNLGHVICAVGLTGNFRQRPADAIEAHALLAARLLAHLNFDSFLYMSSTRVYGGLSAGAFAAEQVTLRLKPSAEALYELTKLVGESLCLAHPSPTVRVVRLSNVVGPEIGESTFIGALTMEALRTGSAVIHDHPESAKDYIMVEDAVAALECVATNGKERLYNIAAGLNVSCAEVASVLAANGYEVKFSGRTSLPRVFPKIDVSRIRCEFGLSPASFKFGFASLIRSRKQHASQTK